MFFLFSGLTGSPARPAMPVMGAMDNKAKTKRSGQYTDKTGAVQRRGILEPIAAAGQLHPKMYRVFPGELPLLLYGLVLTGI